MPSSERSSSSECWRWPGWAPIPSDELMRQKPTTGNLRTSSGPDSKKSGALIRPAQQVRAFAVRAPLERGLLLAFDPKRAFAGAPHIPSIEPASPERRTRSGARHATDSSLKNVREGTKKRGGSYHAQVTTARRPCRVDLLHAIACDWCRQFPNCSYAQARWLR